MSPLDLARVLLALALGAGLANTLFHLRYHHVPLYLDPRSVVGDSAAAPLPRAVLLLGLGAIAAVVAIGSGWWPMITAPVALLMIVGLRRFEVATYGPQIVVRLGKYAPASACLLAGWVAALVGLTLGIDREHLELYAWDAAAGVFGSCYLLAALAKVRETGWSWGKAEHMSVMLAERGFGPAGGLRLWLAQRRLACATIGMTGMVVELAGVLFVWAPLRPALAAVVVVFKLMTWLLFGYFEPEWVLVVMAIGVAAWGFTGMG